MPAPRFIASDIDGTFLDPAHRVTKRLREVLIRAVSGGTRFALATGRPYRFIQPVLDQIPYRPLCVASNGAVLFDSQTNEVVKSHLLDESVMAEIVVAAEEVFAGHGGVGVAVERAGRSTLDPVESLYVVDQFYADNTDWPGFGVAPTMALVEEPAVKLILRNLQVDSAAMYELIAPLVDESAAHVTYSIDEGLIEIAAPGITKVTGVSALAELYGVDASETVTFGDMPNDIEMLRWAGLGVAMGNAADVVKDAADFVTASNGQAGVARVLEQWF